MDNAYDILRDSIESEDIDLTIEEDIPIDKDVESEIDIGKLLLSPSNIARLLNAKANSKGSDSIKALQEIMQIQLGKDRIGNRVEIKFHSGKEISVDEWNTRVEDYLNWESSEIVVLDENIKNNALFSSKEKEVLLNMNKQAKMSLVSIFKHTTHIESPDEK